MIVKIILSLIASGLLIKVLLEIKSIYRLARYYRQGIKCKLYPFLGIAINFVKNKNSKDILMYAKNERKYDDSDLVVWNHPGGTAEVHLMSSQATGEFSLKEKEVARKQRIIDINVFGFMQKGDKAALKSRRIFSKLFHNDNITRMCPQISQIINSHIQRLKGLVKESKNQSVIIDLREDLIMDMMGDVTSYILSGTKKKSELPILPCGLNIVDAARKMLNLWMQCLLDPFNFFIGNWIYKFGLSRLHRKIMKIQKEIDQKAVEEYLERMKNIESCDCENFFNRIVDHNRQMEKNNTPKEKMPLEDIGQNLGLFLVAGSDTSTQTSINLLAQLAENREAQARLSTEMKNWKFGSGGVKTVELNQLEYLQCCFEESLRHQPPVMASVFRKLTKNVEICGKTLYKGDLVVYDILSQAQRELDHENSFEFKPERFSLENRKNISKFSSNPFAQGFRKCLGQYIAEILVKTTVGLIIKNFEIEKAVDFERGIISFYTVHNPKVLLRLRD